MKQLQADVLVIGGGGAGLTAAISAKESGANNVIVLEKVAALGGNTAISHGIFAVESPAQKRLGIHVSADKLFKDRIEEAEWKIDPKLTRDLISRSGDMLQWLEDKGLVFDHIITLAGSGAFGSEEEAPLVFHQFTAGTPSERSIGPGLVEALVKECQRLGVQLLCETVAEKILTDDKGAVSGVLAKAKDEELQIAAKSAIVAAGGFGGSQELIEKYFPSHGEIYSNSLSQMTGDGILIAAEVGAVNDDLVGIGFLGPHHYPWAMSLNLLLQRPHLMLVNKNGERYFNESAQSGGNNALSQQPDIVCYALLDADLLKDTIQSRESINSSEQERGGDNWLDELENDFRKESAEGPAKIADSWDEMAEWIGCDPKALKATIDQYNFFCDKGYDADFLKDKEYLLPLRTPPYYAILGRQGFDTTSGGIKINHRMEVIGQQATPIRGLYAAGDNAAGCLTIAYKYPGQALTFALYSGYIAGENAIRYVLQR